MAVLSAAAVTRRFGERTAVDDVSFDVRAGEIFGLLGPNGAGKTTTLRMLAGLISPTVGEIRVDGQPLTALSGPALRARIGFLTETPGLWEQLTVSDNLLTYARLFGIPRPQGVVEASLKRFDLWERRDDRAAVLSKGMKQKLALARALVNAPAILLLDEPTANLDPQTARGVRDLLLELRKDGCAIVVSTHNLDEVERVADRVALLKTTLIAIGEPAQLRREIFGRRLHVRLAPAGRACPEPGRRSAAELTSIAERAGARDVLIVADGLSMTVDDEEVTVPAVIAALAAAGAAIREAFDERQPLEDVYMRLIHKGPPS
jgi:ABC-2 type transport system ATP-binding protein